MSRPRIALIILGLGLASLVVREAFLAPESPAGGAGVVLPASGPITIAAAGDTLVARGVDGGAGLEAVRAIVAGADLAIANLELVLLGDDEAREAAALPQPRWPFGSGRDAATLASFGIDAVSLANNHALDYGVSGLQATRRLLEGAGVAPAGAGLDLGEAAAPAMLGLGPRRVALLAVTTSFAPDTRATARAGDIGGRPGVHGLRYDADVTVDPVTYETLRGSVAALGAGPAPGDQELEMFGTRIQKGDAVSVTFRVNADDQARILAAIQQARAGGHTVVVSLHSHEPSNGSPEPAAFVREFSRQAIDSGASLVMGHGPHRIRGIERYGDGVILYSLGSFLYQGAAIDFRAADMFDASTDLFGAALGALQPGRVPTADIDSPEWWTGILALVTIDAQGRVEDVRLHPLDLGGGRPVRERGTPVVAGPGQGMALLEELSRLSAELGTTLSAADGVARLAR